MGEYKLISNINTSLIYGDEEGNNITLNKAQTRLSKCHKNYIVKEINKNNNFDYSHLFELFEELINEVCHNIIIKPNEFPELCKELDNYKERKFRVYANMPSPTVPYLNMITDKSSPYSNQLHCIICYGKLT